MIDQISNWIDMNRGVTLVLIIIFFIGIYRLGLYFRKRRENKVTVKEEIKTIPVYIDPDFPQSDKLEDKNLDKLKEMLKFTRAEIRESKKTYDNARNQYNELLALGNKLEKYIPKLEEQEKDVKGQIERIEKLRKQDGIKKN